MTDLAKLEHNLTRLTEEGAETSKIANVVERILSTHPQHITALRCKVVCCLYQKRFGNAIEALDQLAALGKTKQGGPATGEAGFAHTPEYTFQRAYCEYRMLNYTAAKSLLLQRPAAEVHVPSMNLLAQVHYNLEEFREAAALYATILQEDYVRDEEERAEVITNYTAALSAFDAAKTIAVVQDAEEKTADLLYNAAGALVDAGDAEGALSMLKQAEVLCAGEWHPTAFVTDEEAAALPAETLATLLDPSAKDVAERCYFDEVVNVWLMRAYVLHVQRRDEERQRAILQLVMRHKPSSLVSGAIASIHWTALARHSDFFDSHRKLKAAQQPKMRSRLTSRQVQVTYYNMALLHLHTGSLSNFRRTVEQMTRDFPDSDLTHSLRLVVAVREARKKKSNDGAALKKCVMDYEASLQQQQQTGSGSCNNNPRTVQLLLAQIALENNDLAAAAEALAAPALADLRKQPSAVATLAAWRVQLENVAGATALLADAIQSAIQRNEAAVAKALVVWAVHFFTMQGRQLYAEAVQLVGLARKQSAALAEDRDVTALLALCLSHENVAEAQKHLSTLSGISSSTAAGGAKGAVSDKEVQQLLRHQPRRAALEELGYRRATVLDEAEDAAGTRRRRRRVLRRPAKNMEGRPDPERWIPMAHRTSIKDLPLRRKRELKRLRAIEQDHKRRAAEKRKAEAAKAEAEGNA